MYISSGLVSLSRQPPDMSKRTIFTTITPLPAGITRESVIETLHSHVEMIDLNPLVIERHPVKAPSKCTPEEFHAIWYEMTDKVQYLPGGLYSGKVKYNGCFHDLSNGLQTHVYAPLGLDIKGKWSVGGSLPHEPKEPVEMGLGVPKDGLYLREDIDMRCKIGTTTFVKKTLKKAHATLVDRLMEKAHLVEREQHNNRLSEQGSILSYYSSTGPSSPGFPPSAPSPGPERYSRQDVNSFPSAWSSYQSLDHPQPSPPYTHSDFQKVNPYHPDPRYSYQTYKPAELPPQPAPAIHSDIQELDSISSQRYR